jgi:hypothetical protein
MGLAKISVLPGQEYGYVPNLMRQNRLVGGRRSIQEN